MHRNRDDDRRTDGHQRKSAVVEESAILVELDVKIDQPRQGNEAGEVERDRKSPRSRLPELPRRPDERQRATGGRARRGQPARQGRTAPLWPATRDALGETAGLLRRSRTGDRG